MLYALATPGSSFKPSVNRPKNTWRLTLFKDIYLEKASRENTPNNSEASSPQNSINTYY